MDLRYFLFLILSYRVAYLKVFHVHSVRRSNRSQTAYRYFPFHSGDRLPINELVRTTRKKKISPSDGRSSDGLSISARPHAHRHAHAVARHRRLLAVLQPAVAPAPAPADAPAPAPADAATYMYSSHHPMPVSIYTAAGVLLSLI